MSIQIPKEISLTDDEIPIWFGQMSWVSMWFVLLIAVLCFFTIILVFISIICVIMAWIEISTSEYFISSKRIYIKRGLVSRVINDIKIEWITNIFVTQGIFGRILNFGNIGISTPGERGGTIGFMGVSDPLKVKAIIEDTLAKYKKNS
ncbi:MAG: PH domain-containing protein [Methanoregula sp.]